MSLRIALTSAVASAANAIALIERAITSARTIASTFFIFEPFLSNFIARATIVT
jgi:hypothetical protein